MRFQVFGSRALPWFWATILFVMATGALTLQLLGPPKASNHSSPKQAVEAHRLLRRASAGKPRNQAQHSPAAFVLEEVHPVAEHPASDQHPSSITPTDRQSASATAPNDATKLEEPATPAPSHPLSPSVTATLITRGEEMVSTGNIAVARLLFERAANAGSAFAAEQAAKMYDPDFLASLHVKGIEPSVATAASWYRQAAALGDHEAEIRLGLLTAQASK
jgi:TPR repeat protein